MNRRHIFCKTGRRNRDPRPKPAGGEITPIFSAGEASEEELLLVASGKMRMAKELLNVEELLKIRTGRVSGNEAVRALLEDRAENFVSR